jgi:hypothetical protein
MMCPVCLTGIALIIGTMASTGGLTALVLKCLRRNQRPSLRMSSALALDGFRRKELSF